jgi:MtrB/PioB family decaheme-associated outer membrane protein
MKTKQNYFFVLMVLTLLTFPPMTWGQDEDPFALEGVESEIADQPVVDNEISIGLYFLDDDSYRYGKYTGLIDDGVEALIDFRIEKRPDWNGGDTSRWRFQAWRLGLDSRRVEFKFNKQGTHSFKAEYREIPNYRFSDGMTPYRGVGSNTLVLASDWAIAEGSSNTRGFLTLNESLANLKVDTKRKRLDLSYSRKLGRTWSLDVDYLHEQKKGVRTIGSIFGYTGGNPRAVILPAPVDYNTDNIEAMFRYATTRVQFGIGFFASFFSNDKTSLTWQNAYGHHSQWQESVHFPSAQGRLALEPDNSYLQFKANVGYNLAPSTRLSADISFGEMEQNERILPFTVNPELDVHTPIPLASTHASIDTAMVNLRLTSQLARRMGLALSYHLDDRDNKTPRAVYPYIGGDSQNQRPDEDGRINLPYSYKNQKADAIVTYRFGGGVRFKGGIEYSDIEREYSEVSDADELAWLAGIRFSGMETASLSFNYRNSTRDVDAYIGNVPLIESHIPGTVAEDEWENHPLLRKYFLTDRDRDEIRFRADVFPNAKVNFGLAGSYFNDDYDDGFFGLNEAKIRALTLDMGWYPAKNTSLTAYYTREMYDSSQSSRSFRNTSGAADPDNNWFANTEDEVDTYNVSLIFSDIGADKGWKSFSLGFDYTYSKTESLIDVTAATAATAPLPALKTKLRSISGWASLAVGERSSIRLSVEGSQLDTDDFGLDNVVPDTLANVLTLGESAANYDLILVSGSWTYRF